jgi:hypothetical protein
MDPVPGLADNDSPVTFRLLTADQLKVLGILDVKTKFNGVFEQTIPELTDVIEGNGFTVI